MFGKNAVTSPFRDKDGKLLVNEIFYTLQGEGPDAGCPAVFVRLSKCNLRCYFCDTEFETGKPMTVAQVGFAVQEMTKNNNCRLVVITGGEPLLQNIVPLVHVLNQNGVRVSVETAGTVWSRELEGYFTKGPNKIVCSPKTQGLNKDILPFIAAWKYVVSIDNSSDVDGLPCMSTQAQGQVLPIFKPRNHPSPIYVQPMDQQDVVLNDANVKLCRDLAMKHGYRLSLQVHKLVGLP